MLDARFVPLTAWRHVETDADIRTSPFKASWSDTLSILEQELWHLRAADVSIGCFLPRSAIRHDGWPKSGAAAPHHPGVEVSFQMPGFDRRRVYATDNFRTYEQNLRAIALAFRALRAVDRYGVTPEGQQHAGFAELPPGEPAARELDLARGEDLVRMLGRGGALRATHPDTRDPGSNLTQDDHDDVKAYLASRSAPRGLAS